MKRTTKEFLEWLGLKVGDKIKVDNKIYRVISVNDVPTLEFEENNVSGYWIGCSYLIDKEYEIVKPPILTDKEKEYLSAVIKPFRDRIIFIQKISCEEDLEFIVIKLNSFDKNGTEILSFPYFKKDTMYKGMEEGKKYSLEELGL